MKKSEGKRKRIISTDAHEWEKTRKHNYKNGRDLKEGIKMGQAFMNAIFTVGPSEIKISHSSTVAVVFF